MRDLFSSLATEGAITTRRRYAVPLSVLTHAVLIGVLIVAPLTISGAIPTPASVLVFALPALPLPPPPPALVTPAPMSRSASTVPLAPSAPVSAPSVTSPEPAPSSFSLVTNPSASTVLDSRVTTLGPPAIDAAQPTAPVPVGGEVREPRRIFGIAPVYPSAARAARVEGSVVIEATIGRDGAVHDMRVVRSHPMFDRAALDAVRQWRYVPTTLNGEPVDVLMVVKVQFQLR